METIARDPEVGAIYKGKVTRLMNFGAFVEIAPGKDGLVHISQITDRFIKHPSEVLKVGDIVKVWVISCEPAKNRISLTMRKEKVFNEKE